MVLEKAETDSYFKYGIYTSRSLMVKHPEIYLQADDLFLKAVQTNAGFQKSYEIDDVHNEYLLGNELTGPAFSFDLVDFAKYEIIGSAGIYPDKYPVLPYVDRRLLSIASTLKPAGIGVTQLAKAEQYYFSLKEKGTVLDQLYLVYCDNENAYIHHQGDLIVANGLQKASQIEGNPVLIFNEKSVWYPLMERDDTSKDATLRQIVTKYATDLVVPELSDFEAGLVSRFVKATALGDSQVNMAVIAAARNWEREDVLQNKPFMVVWEKTGIWDKFPLRNLNARIALVQGLLLKSNYLSPITAYLSAVIEDQEGEARIEALCREYLAHTISERPWAHGHIWMCGIMEFNIEDSYYAYAGCCTTQAANIKAPLDILGIDSYWIHARFPEPPLEGHSHIYIPEQDLVVDNGRVNRTPTTYHASVLCNADGRETPRQCVTFIEYSGKWANLNPIDRYCGTLSPREAIDILNFLTSVHNDELRGITYNFTAISSGELINRLEAQKRLWMSLKLP
ncbi:MAG: hypothetical protein PHN78_06125 [Dehalococcoidales bacterium]|nr:hypothetical protein [Dehalococcoidales bacterium]